MSGRGRGRGGRVTERAPGRRGEMAERSVPPPPGGRVGANLDQLRMRNSGFHSCKEAVRGQHPLLLLFCVGSGGMGAFLLAIWHSFGSPAQVPMLSHLI